MSSASNLSNQFLIAMPALGDPNFFQSVSFICEHGDQGAIGIIFNRPMDITLSEVFNQLDIEVTDDSVNEMPVFFGGPVHVDRGFVIHTPNETWRSSLKMSEEIYVTTSRDILEAIAKGEGPDKYIVALGYAGWGADQLEKEITENSWLNCPASANILFNTPTDKQWEAAAKLLGIDIKAISGDIGHA